MPVLWEDMPVIGAMRLAWLGHGLERRFEDLVHPGHGNELQLVQNFLGHFLEIGLVALGNDHPFDSGPMCRQDFLFQAADR